MVRVGHLLKHDLGGGAVSGVRGGDHHPQQQTEGVDHDVPPAPIDQLAAVEATAVRPDDGDRVRLSSDQETDVVVDDGVGAAPWRR